MNDYGRAALIAALCAVPAGACDLCSIYNVNAAEGTRNTGLSISLVEQFTYFGTLQNDGHHAPNPVDQYLNSSISQAVLGYTFTDWASVQFSVPLIYREFKRPEGFTIDRGTESGIGDVSLLANFTPFRREHMHSTLAWHLFGGVKMPTGDTDRLKEEFNELEIPGAPESGIHGHDLALGSGSYDAIVGTGIYARYKRVFFDGNFHYTFRTEGDFGYRYADDLDWFVAPGVYLVLKEEWTMAAQFVAGGEDKDLDRFRHEDAEDTGITSVFVGPQFSATWTDKLSGSVGVGFPVLLDNTALQAVPDYRVRAAVTWRF